MCPVRRRSLQPAPLIPPPLKLPPAEQLETDNTDLYNFLKPGAVEETSTGFSQLEMDAIAAALLVTTAATLQTSSEFFLDLNPSECVPGMTASECVPDLRPKYTHLLTQ